MNKCFCHLYDEHGNKYIVKDSEARKSIEELNKKVDNFESPDIDVTDKIEENNTNPVTSGAVYNQFKTLVDLLEQV